jgi:hypothetical protein
MFNQSSLADQLARQRSAELQEASRRARLAGHTAGVPRTRAYAARLLIALGTRLAPTEARATNRVTKLAGH